MSFMVYLELALVMTNTVLNLQERICEEGTGGLI